LHLAVGLITTTLLSVWSLKLDYLTLCEYSIVIVFVLWGMLTSSF
jgi:hypothetical protein